MKTQEYFPMLSYSASRGLLNDMLIVITCAVLLYAVWSICSLSGGYLGTVGGLHES